MKKLLVIGALLFVEFELHALLRVLAEAQQLHESQVTADYILTTQVTAQARRAIKSALLSKGVREEIVDFVLEDAETYYNDDARVTATDTYDNFEVKYWKKEGKGKPLSIYVNIK